MCMSSTQCFITSTGHTAPAMIPVRSDGQVRLAKSGWFEHRDEHRRHAVDAGAAFGFDRVAASGRGSKPGAGITIVAPWVVQPRLPITMPKQW